MRSVNGGRRLAVLLLMALGFACHDNAVNPLDLPPELPQNLKIYASIDGGMQNAGLLKLSANSLELEDSVGTGRGVPFSVGFSTDYSNWYSIWAQPGGNQGELFCFDNRTMTLVKSVPVPFAGQLATDKDQRILITYPNTPLAFYDLKSLLLLFKDSTIGTAWQVRPSHIESKLFLTRGINKVFAGLAVYSLSSLKLEQTIPVADSTRMSAMQPVDLAISPDDNLAFLSVFNWVGGGGYNSCIEIDINKSKVVREFPCGAFAQLGMSPDGASVYLTDPGGYLYQMARSNQLLRFDVRTQSLEVFLRLSDLKLNGTVFLSDKVIVAPDNRTLFVSIDGDIKQGELPVHILKLDSYSKRVLAIFSLSVDTRGFVTQQIRNLTLGYDPR